uniref:Uncharacterized protein n=1 Tax=Magallana gigas TaxID=29159 RepID=K1PE54_MAGGI
MDQRTADRVLSELAHLREMFSSKSKKALKMPDGIQVSFKVARSAGEKNCAIEALRRVWRNMRDGERRREKGKKELHRRQSKQAKRIRDAIFTSDSLGIQQRRQKSKVTRSATEMTMTPPPRDIPDWAISTTYHLDG